MSIFFQRFIFSRSKRGGESSIYKYSRLDDLVSEPAPPGRHAFQTLISQELLELNGAKPHIVPILNCALSKPLSFRPGEPF